MSSKPVLTTQHKISTLLPSNRRNRQITSALLYLEHSGSSLRDVAEQYGLSRARLHEWYHAIEADLPRIMAVLKLNAAGPLVHRAGGRPWYHHNTEVAAIKLAEFGQALRMKPRKSTMRLSKIAALAFVFGTTSLMSASAVLAASDCSTSVTLADWGENSTGDIDVASGGSCLFPIKIRGTVSSSEILQKPSHGKLKKLNMTAYEYKARARYKGEDAFAIKATGQGPTGSGTSVITVHAAIK